MSSEERTSELSEASGHADEQRDETLPRRRNLTEKGRLERVSALKRNKTSALTAVTKNRTLLSRLMSDENNLHLVKAELSNLNRAYDNLQDAFNAYLDVLDEDDTENEYSSFEAKERSILDFRRIVIDWISQAEKCLQDQLDPLEAQSEISVPSLMSHKSFRSSLLRRTSNRARLAELHAEKSMLSKKQELHHMNEQFKLDIEIIKAEAREKVYAEEEEKDARLLMPDTHPRSSHEQINQPSASRATSESALTSQTSPPTVIQAPIPTPRVPTPLPRKRFVEATPPVHVSPTTPTISPQPHNVPPGLNVNAPLSTAVDQKLLVL